MGGLKTFYTPQKIFSVCVCGGAGGLKTETGKFHEILTVFFLLLHEHLQLIICIYKCLLFIYRIFISIFFPE